MALTSDDIKQLSAVLATKEDIRNVKADLTHTFDSKLEEIPQHFDDKLTAQTQCLSGRFDERKNQPDMSEEVASLRSRVSELEDIVETLGPTPSQI